MKKEFGPYSPNFAGTVVTPCFPAWTFGRTIADHADDRQRGAA
jgi:hypothetical protein